MISVCQNAANSINVAAIPLVFVHLLHVFDGFFFGLSAMLLDELVDRHGTGRVIFRNSRDSLTGFPERKGLPQKLAPRKTLSEEELQARVPVN